ncbi:MAG: hypothetical protein AAF581_11205 [Planctomycetota bacterium]
MAALTKDTPRSYMGNAAPGLRLFKVAANTTIYQGGALAKTATGEVSPFTDGDVFAGFASDGIKTDDSTGVDLEVYTEGKILLNISASTASAIGTSVYVTTDGDFSLTDSGSDTVLGVLYHQKSASSTWWYVDFKGAGNQ